MDRETLTKQMKAMKKKAQDAKTAGQKAAAQQFNKASSRLWRKLKQLAPAVAAKIEEG
jgi:hypothetical protein